MLISKKKKHSGNDESFKILIETTKKHLYKLAYSILRDEQKSEDVVQDTFITAWEKLGQLQDKSKFNSWVRTIAINKAKKYYLKYKNEVLMDDDEKIVYISSEEVCIDLPDEIVQQKEFKLLLLDEINKLNGYHSDIIYLYFFGDLTYDEIAYHLKIPINTVGTRLYRAKQKLKENIKNNLYFENFYKKGGANNE